MISRCEASVTIFFSHACRRGRGMRTSALSWRKTMVRQLFWNYRKIYAPFVFILAAVSFNRENIFSVDDKILSVGRCLFSPNILTRYP